MACWLLKTEPSAYAWENLVRDKTTVWDGITNALALMHLRAAAAGDRVLIYHTGGERRAVGIAKIVKGPRPDTRRANLAVVDLAPVKPLASPVTLEQIKADPAFAGWELLRISRLSFVPVPEPMWKRILELSNKK